MRRVPATLVVGIGALIAAVIVGAIGALLDLASSTSEHGIEIEALGTVAIAYNVTAIRFAATALCAHGAWRLADRSHGVERAGALAWAAASALVIALLPVGMILPRVLGTASYVHALGIVAWVAWALTAVVRASRLIALGRRAPATLLAVSAVAGAILTVAWMPGIMALDERTSSLGRTTALAIGSTLALIELGAFARALLAARIAEPSPMPARAAGGLRLISAAAVAGYAAILVLVIGTIGAAQGWQAEIDLLRYTVPGIAGLAAFALAAGGLRASDAGLDLRASIGLAVTALVAFSAIWLELAAIGLADRPYGGEVAQIYANLVTAVTWSGPLWLAATPIALAVAIDRVTPSRGRSMWAPALALAGIVIAAAAWSAHVVPAGLAGDVVVGAVGVLVIALGATFALALAVRRVASHLGGMPSLPTAVARDRA